jgi:hypothetical protein
LTIPNTHPDSGPDTRGYHALFERLCLSHGAAFDKDWSAAPDFLERIVAHAIKHKPGLIVECGSGVTTLLLARCCAMNRRGEVFSLENGVEYVVKTRMEITRHGLETCASTLYAPLTPYMIEDREYQWYTLRDLPERSIDMLVIDGPPGFIQKHSRYPALPLLYDKLADGCAIYLDDAARPDEREVVAMWLARYPALSHEYVDAERGCSILRLQRTA